MYTLDTNSIIYYLKDDPRATLRIRDILQKNVPIYISAITELELFSYSDLTDPEAELIVTLLKSLSVIPLDSQLARIAGEVRRNFKLKVPDSAIAATALFTGTTLLTRNVRDFQKVPFLRTEKI